MKEKGKNRRINLHLLYPKVGTKSRPRSMHSFPIFYKQHRCSPKVSKLLKKNDRLLFCLSTAALAVLTKRVACSTAPLPHYQTGCTAYASVCKFACHLSHTNELPLPRLLKILAPH